MVMRVRLHPMVTHKGLQSCAGFERVWMDYSVQPLR